MEINERFENLVMPEPNTGCYLWFGETNQDGYGRFWDGKKKVQAHRYSYTVNHGEIPDGMCVCHTCDTPACVNPSHLFAGTRSDNTQDMLRKGRQSRHMAKITRETALLIRASSESNRVLGKKYGLNNSVISNIKNGILWK